MTLRRLSDRTRKTCHTKRQMIVTVWLYAVWVKEQERQTKWQMIVTVRLYAVWVKEQELIDWLIDCFKSSKDRLKGRRLSPYYFPCRAVAWSYRSPSATEIRLHALTGVQLRFTCLSFPIVRNKSKTEMTSIVQENMKTHNMLLIRTISIWIRQTNVQMFDIIMLPLITRSAVSESEQGFIGIVCYTSLLVCRFVKGKHIMRKLCKLFCLVQIKNRSYLTACVFWST